MRLVHTFAIIALAASALGGTAALAGEPLHLTPPLYREQARTIRQTRAAADLYTTPQPVSAAKPADVRRTVEVVAEAAPLGAR